MQVAAIDARLFKFFFLCQLRTQDLALWWSGYPLSIASVSVNFSGFALWIPVAMLNLSFSSDPPLCLFLSFFLVACVAVWGRGVLNGVTAGCLFSDFVRASLSLCRLDYFQSCCFTAEIGHDASRIFVCFCWLFRHCERSNVNILLVQYRLLVVPTCILVCYSLLPKRPASILWKICNQFGALIFNTQD